MGTAKERVARATLSALSGMTTEDRQRRHCSMPDAAVMLDTNARALDRARLDQARALAAEERIDGLSFASLAFMPALSGSGRYTCSLEEIHQLLERR